MTTKENKSDELKTYERNGIKFQYTPLAKEGTNKMTTLRAIKDLSSYTAEFATGDIEDILPIAKVDIDIFNRVIHEYLSGTLKSESHMKIIEENKITIGINLDIFGAVYPMEIVLLHENIDEITLLKRKVASLMEKVDRSCNTIKYTWRSTETDYDLQEIFIFRKYLEHIESCGFELMDIDTSPIIWLKEPKVVSITAKVKKSAKKCTHNFVKIEKFPCVDDNDNITVILGAGYLGKWVYHASIHYQIQKTKL